MIQPVYPSQWIKEVATSYACLTLECQPYAFLYDLNYGKISLHVPNVIRPKWFRGVTQPNRIGLQEKSLVFIYQGRKSGGRKKHLLPAQQIPRARNTEYVRCLRVPLLRVFIEAKNAPIKYVYASAVFWLVHE